METKNVHAMPKGKQHFTKTMTVEEQRQFIRESREQLAGWIAYYDQLENDKSKISLPLTVNDLAFVSTSSSESLGLL